MTKLEKLRLIYEVFERLDEVSGENIQEIISNAIYNIRFDIDVEGKKIYQEKK